MWADPNVTRFIGGRPSTPQQTLSRVLAYLGHWKVMGFGYWAIEERSSGAFIGEIGFADFKRGISSQMDNVPELGFALSSRVHGLGYGTEAVGVVLSWGDEHLPSNRTVALVNEQNEASLRILARYGYQAFERGNVNGSPVMFLERISPGSQ